MTTPRTPDAFDAWAADHDLPATTVVDGVEVLTDAYTEALDAITTTAALNAELDTIDALLEVAARLRNLPAMPAATTAVTVMARTRARAAVEAAIANVYGAPGGLADALHCGDARTANTVNRLLLVAHDAGVEVTL